MKTLKVSTIVLAVAMSIGIHGYASTSSADVSATAAEQNRNISAAEIKALQQRAEFDTQAALGSKAGDGTPRYDARTNDRTALSDYVR